MSSLTERRSAKFKSFQKDAWYSKYFKKLKESDLEFCFEFIETNGELSDSDWEMKVNRMWLDRRDPRPKNGMVMMEMLSASKKGIEITKVLLIEDTPELIELMTAHLLQEFEVVHSIDKEEIGHFIPMVDVVVCDYHFNPNCSFKDVVAMVDGKVPVILCTSDDMQSYINQIDKSKIHGDLINKVKELTSVSH